MHGTVHTGTVVALLCIDEHSLSLGVDLDGLLDVFGSLLLELLAISTMAEFIFLVVIASACDYLYRLLSGYTFIGGRFIVVSGDVLSNDGVVFGNAITFGVNVWIKLIGLKSDYVMGREAACLCFMVVSDATNDAM
ncbi:unnamed protein product [Lactuca saligna]|uniref:Uncharacterized protein n=1 Tax=Lactuca saligna TaxID=75948 RepID=A0AA35ZQ57_LACSI|nr:unnamed protein product [Lactuca saligna]